MAEYLQIAVSGSMFGHWDLLLLRTGYWLLEWIFEHAPSRNPRIQACFSDVLGLATFPGQAGDVRVCWEARQTPFFSP